MSEVNEIYIRPLQHNDAKVSYKWRNDYRIWEYTGSKPDKKITLSMEREWIKGILTKKSEKRFAICICNTNEYIGNVQLTNLTDQKAEFHIFIGEQKFWGQGIGKKATVKILEIAFRELRLMQVYLYVNKKNIAALSLYTKTGFEIKSETRNKYHMVCNNFTYLMSNNILEVTD